MKRLLVIFTMLFLVCAGVATAQEEVTYPVYDYDLTIATSGTTTGINQTAGYSGVSWFLIDRSEAALDIKELKNGAAAYSIQLYAISLADSNVDGRTLTTGMDSGATLTMYYQQGNVDSANLWAGSGVTAIGSTVALSGQTCETIEFFPEFGRYYRLGVLTGITPFEQIRAKLVVQ